MYGVDVASVRLDDLDKRVIAVVEAMVRDGKHPRVLDVGCGRGGLVSELARIGVQVTGLDVGDYQAAIECAGAEFYQSDIRDWLRGNTETFDVVVLQRVLHYVPYGDAGEILRKLRVVTDTLYLSVTGLQTAIANHYDAGKHPLQSRWGSLDASGQELFSITEPLCLYAESEIQDLLVETGWEVVWSRVSDFGNIKVEARLPEVV